MKSTYTTIMTLAAAALARDFNTISPCVSKCIELYSKSCGTDIVCFCGTTGGSEIALDCLFDNCPQAERNTFYNLMAKYCHNPITESTSTTRMTLTSTVTLPFPSDAGSMTCVESPHATSTIYDEGVSPTATSTAYDEDTESISIWISSDTSSYTDAASSTELPSYGSPPLSANSTRYAGTPRQSVSSTGPGAQYTGGTGRMAANVLMGIGAVVLGVVV